MLGSTSRFFRRSAAPLFVVAFVAAFFAFSAHAQIDAGADVAAQAGLATTDVRILIANIIKGFLVLLGIVAVAIVMYAGYLWMTAAGEADRVQRAQKIMANAGIGLFIILASYGIVAFIFNAITGGQSGFGIGGGGSQFTGIFQGTAGTDALGSGIIEYHFPEPGQRDIARNTKISITFKQPLVLSTVFKNYDDKGTYSIADDTDSSGQPLVPGAFELNTDNFRILQEDALGTAGSGSVDAQFLSRYPEASLITPSPGAEATGMPAEFSSLARQTLVIAPRALLGSSTGDVTYRVGLKGGANGVKVWDVNAAGIPVQEPAFGRMTAEGGYRWSFATNTQIDQTAPKITAVVPDPVPNPAAGVPVPRNQLVQMYFSEAIDPTRVSGEMTATGGAVSVRVEARCKAGATDCDARYRGTDFAAVPGSYTLGNKYKTIEFIPSTQCENVSENSCGDKVFCLPKNVDLQVRAIAADVGSEPPTAVGTTGVIDMVGNSLDGNGDGQAVGPVSATRGAMFNLNVPQKDLSGVSDTAVALYALADTVDLTPPAVIGIDPKSVAPSGSPDVSTPYAEGGPSGFPPTAPIKVDWNKVISISSIRTGKADDARATLVLDSRECVKNGNSVCTVTQPCSCTPADAPWFFVDFGEPEPVQGGEGSKLEIYHRPFFTANELGYTEGDIAAFPQGVPRFVPQLRAKIKDVRQNCFYPSVGFSCPAGEMIGPDGKSSCCDREAQNDFSCPP